MSQRGFNTESYPLQRDYAASSRLNLQSYLWRDSLGYTIHPTIPSLAEDARVADIATGTGIWLMQLARELRSSLARLDGFDIDISQCPPQQWMPLNVTFHAWNAFDETPTEMHGQYDLVHIRLFMINIKNNDASALIRNVHRMLKPGGWLQWEEVDNTNNSIVTTDASIKTPAMECLLEYIHEGSKRHRGGDEWLLGLPQTLSANGFQNVTMQSHTDPPMLRRWFYEAWLLTLQEFSTTKLKGTEQEATNLTLIGKSHVECKQGAAIQLGKLICIAQKIESSG